jgi:quercetin dioxygenase-like cupin family protein
MNYNLLRLIVLAPSLWVFLAASESYAHDSGIKVERILEATHSWDGTAYVGHATGQPQITVLKIKVPAHTALDWHQHPMISAGYVLSGRIILEKRDTGQRKIIHAGQALAESVNTVHRGYTTDEPVELVVFYAGAVGLPLSIKAK